MREIWISTFQKRERESKGWDARVSEMRERGFCEEVGSMRESEMRERERDNSLQRGPLFYIYKINPSEAFLLFYLLK